MHRHPALAPLSRDHHLALQLARGIQKTASPHLRSTLPAGTRALAAHVIAVFADELEGHFDAEEKLLIEAVRGREPELDALSAEIVREHSEMREMARQLALPDLSDGSCMELLDRLGVALEAHVRKEERSLFERVQALLDEGALLRLGARVERHLHEHCLPRSSD